MSPPSEFDQLTNFRDVALSVNSRNQPTSLRPGLLFRSARPDETTLQDPSMLVDKYKIKTIIDLRTTTELINATKTYDCQAASDQPQMASFANNASRQPLKIPGIQYAEINLNGKGFERSLMWHLSYYGLARVIGYMALGYRMEAISIIGKEVLQPRGLIGLAIDTIEHSQPEIAALFDLMSRRDRWPVMVHCTQGKDRTGLAVILVLLLCNADIDDITNDYIKSEPDSEATLNARLKDTSSIGLDESFARCPQDLPKRVKHHIDEKYGSIKQYLHKVGVPHFQLQQIQEILLQESDEDPAG